MPETGENEQDKIQIPPEGENEHANQTNHDKYIGPVLNARTAALMKTATARQLDNAFSDKWNDFMMDPELYGKIMGDTVVLEMCVNCMAPAIMHVTKKDEPCKLAPFPSNCNSYIAQNIEKLEHYKPKKRDLTYTKIHKEKQAQKAPQYVQNITSEKRSKIPAYLEDNYAYWEKLVRSWDELYPATKPLDKYLELIDAIQKGGGDELVKRIQSEGLDYHNVDIITKCLKKLAGYLERTVMTTSEEINNKWNTLWRGDLESTKDYVARWEHIRTLQKENGLKMSEKQAAIQLFAKANLDTTARNIVIPQFDLNSAQACQQLRTALLNVTPTGGSGSSPASFYEDRGRNRYRDQRNRSRSFSASRGYRKECGCPCYKHEKDHIEKKDNRSGRSRDRANNRANSSSRKEHNAGNNYAFVNSVYLSLSGKQIVIDTGCVRSLISKHDVPYLEKLIGKKTQPTGKSYSVKFGDNKTTQTEAVILVPFWDGKKQRDLEIGIVHDRIPFLLGLNYLRELNGRLVIDERMELENGASFPMMGGGYGHQRIEWTEELHNGHKKVRHNIDSNESSYYEQEDLSQDLNDPVFGDFCNDFEMVCFKADITVNSRDRLLDDEGSKYLRHFSPISRKGSYDDTETDAVYLYRNNMTENMPVSDPFIYSDYENSILKVTHDRGISNGIDLEPELEEDDVEKVKKSVRFDENAELYSFDILDSPLAFPNLSHVTLKDSEKTYYAQLTTHELDIKDYFHLEVEKEPIYYTIDSAPVDFTKHKPIPEEWCFHVRSSGHIQNLHNRTTYVGSDNKNYQTFVEEKTGKKLSFKDGILEKTPEELLNEVELESETESIVERNNDIDDYSKKQAHNAHKKRAPKKKAIRGKKQSSQGLKPNANIPGIKQAMDEEIEKFKKFHVFEEVDDSPYTYKVPSNWVVTKKDDKKEGKSEYKCRLVALGNLDRKINLRATDSPTLSRESLRLILSTIANKGFKLQGMDVSAAFLQGAPLDREVFMNPPKEYKTEGKIWLLKKPVYGLADAGRLWYKRLRDEILSLGCKDLTGDSAVFLMHEKGKLIGIIGTHVDDLIYGGTPEFEEKVIEPIMTTFNISKTDHKCFVFCGMSLRQNSDLSITVTQKDYASSIDDIPDYKNMSDPEKTTLLKSIAGQVGYLSLTRPDLMFSSSELLRVGKTLDERLKLAEKLLKKVKDGSGEIVFRKLGNLDELSLYCYSDASYNNIKYGKVSTAGCVLFLKGGAGTCAPLMWVSKPIIRVTRSTMAAEARALELAVDYAILYSRQIREIYTGIRTTTGIDVHCFTDSHTLHDAIVSTRQIEEKSLVHLIYCLKDKILHSEVSRITWIRTNKMLADSLTKAEAPTDRLMYMISTGHFPNCMNI